MEMKLSFESNAINFSPILNNIDKNPESSLCSPGDSRTALTVGAVN
ncbi:MAG: hypothetical protein LBS81_05500 [Endomicrobium sp.]|jgi:hypothetical protein|nr:hypothetical protein [Endomicrobium sp.]